jgi:hypothetical protein
MIFHRTIRMHGFRAVMIAGLALGVFSLSARGEKSGQAAVKTDPSAPVEHLSPYKVKAEYPNVEVLFVLSRKDIFHPLADPVARGDVVRVEGGDLDSQMDIRPSDQLLSINGIELRGHTLPEIANILTEARKAGIPVWEIRRGFMTLTVHFDGDWLVPLPGLKR